MIKFILPLLITYSTFAGVGGISGGTDKFQRGAHIEFQKESTWVNAEFSRTLCTDGTDYFAKLRKCTIRSNDDEAACLSTELIEAQQPIVSQRQRCALSSSNGNCKKWITVPFIQSPKRIVIPSEEQREGKEKKIVIPKCK